MTKFSRYDVTVTNAVFMIAKSFEFIHKFASVLNTSINPIVM